jgi:integrase
MALTDLAVRQAKARGVEYTLGDGDGLALRVTTTGAKYWHFRYFWLGKQKRMSFGTYPEVSLRDARDLRHEARALLAKNINPHHDRKRKRLAARLAADNTFEAVYQKWLAHRSQALGERPHGTLAQIRRVFANDVLPFLQAFTVTEITSAHLLDVVGRIEARNSLSIAQKVRQWLSQLFAYALVAVPGMQINPASSLNIVAAPPPPVQHYPFLRLSELPQFLRTLRLYPGTLSSQLAIRLMLLTGVRTGELRQATPDQFDVDRGLWIIPPDKVKQLKFQMRRKRLHSDAVPPYIVPLSVQAVEIVRYLLEQVKPAQRYLFSSIKSLKDPISENTLNRALQRMGYQNLLTGHGIRATISTALHEIGYPKSWIDAQLSHADPDRISASYNHAEYVEQRRAMMQDWADRLDLLEQNQVDAASMQLTIHLEGLPQRTGMPASAVSMHRSALSPVLIVTAPQTRSPPASMRRLPAVSLPRRAQPPVSEFYRVRLTLFEEFEAPHNLSVAEFAKLMGKSRRWVSYEIKARRLLALTLGNREMRIPDWHFDPLKHNLIVTILGQVDKVDAWRVYYALSRPHHQLGSRVPIEAVTPTSLRKVIHAVQSSLGAEKSA